MRRYSLVRDASDILIKDDLAYSGVGLCYGFVCCLTWSKRGCCAGMIVLFFCWLCVAVGYGNCDVVIGYELSVEE